MVSNYDLIVIGGGINGLGIAGQAAAAGLSVLIVEKGDWGGGTTATSSRLIHGGLRYLQYGELALVRESLRERGHLVRRRPHLIRPIELLIPAYDGAEPPRWKVAIGLRLYDLLARDPLFPSPRLLNAGEVLSREPALSPEGLQGGALYPDAQVEFPERLCIELLRESLEQGAEAWNHHRVIRLLWEQGRVVGCQVRDELTGAERAVSARMVVNAAGPWVDAVNRLLPKPPPRLIGGTWGTHVVLPARPGGPRGPLYASARKDGRPFFILPWDGRLLVGTTDVKFEGDPDQVRSQAWETDYLLEEINRLFPACEYADADVQMTTVGVRPLPASKRPAGAVTRRHFLVDHGARHGLPGLGSVVGGKLTTYRSLSEQVVTWVLRKLERPPAPADSSEEDGPTSGLLERATTDAAKCGISVPTAERWTRLYGPRYTEILQLVRADAELRRPLREGRDTVEAEVVHAVRNERARTVDDIARRRLMLLPPAPTDVEAIRGVAKRYGLALG